MEQPDNTIGYWAVVIPSIDEFQGFFLVDDPALHRQAVQFQMKAMLTMPTGVIGALQATIIEGVTTARQDIVAPAALALYGIVKHRFALIKGDRQGGGTHSSMTVLKSNDITDARDEIDRHPDVVAIKQRLASKFLHGRKQ